MPGDDLGVIEEYIPGTHTYVEEGVIRSRILGYVAVSDSRVASVIPVKRAALIGPGDIVAGRVVASGRGTLTVKILESNGVKLLFPCTGILYLKSGMAAVFFKVGDLVRARVESDKNYVYHLVVNGRELGVVYAFCSRCGGFLEKKRVRQVLQCTKCGNREKRKVTMDYGSWRVASK